MYNAYNIIPTVHHLTSWYYLLGGNLYWLSGSANIPSNIITILCNNRMKPIPDIAGPNTVLAPQVLVSNDIPIP